LFKNNFARSWQLCASFLFQSGKLFLNKCKGAEAAPGSKLSIDYSYVTGQYPSYVHIGVPPVIGADGISYGFYESPDLEAVPITPAGDKAEWTTQVAVPQDVKGFYTMLSVESKRQRLFVNYAVDVADK
jgi:hypothetical protein